MFTDIDVPGSYYKDVLRRQAVVNAGLTLNFTDEKEKDPATGKPWHESWCYQNGIADYVAEVAGEDTLTPVFSCESEAVGRDREDQPDYKVRMSAAFCFSNKVQLLEYYHNSSWLEHGGSPDRAVRLAFVNQINNWLKNKGLYKKNESSITFNDVQDCLILVSSSFSTRTSYENQTKKAITNKFIQEAMTEFLRSRLEIYFIENRDAAEKIAAQVLINKRSRETAEKTRINQKKKLTEKIDIANRVQKFVDWLNGLSEGTKKTVVTIALLAAALGPVLIVIGKVISAVGTIMTVVPKIAGVINTVKGAFAALNTTMLANPIVLIIAAIAALVAAFIYLWNNCDGFRQFWIDLWENVKQVAITVWNAIKEFFSQVWEAIKTIFSTVFEVIKTLVTTYFNLYKTIIQTVFNVIKTVITTIWEAIKGVFTTVFNVIKTLVTTYFNIYKTIIQTVLTIIQTVITTVWNTNSHYYCTECNKDDFFHGMECHQDHHQCRGKRDQGTDYRGFYCGQELHYHHHEYD